MRKQNKKFIPLIAFAVLAVAVLIAIFVPFEYTIKGPGRFVAQAEWTISHAEQDKLQTRLFFNDLNSSASVGLFHVNRPDYVTFSIKEGLTVGDHIKQGEIVAHLNSTEDQIRLATAMGELEQANAQLAALRTGAKRPLQEEADQALQFSKAQLAAYEPVLKRQQTLFEQQLVSSQEFEIVKAQYDLYKIDMALQEARLRTARTGEKAELLAVIEAQIRATTGQLELLHKKASAETMRAPITGVLVQPNDALGELLHICKTDTMVIQMPVKASEVQYLAPGRRIATHITGQGRWSKSATLIGISQNTRLINMQPMYIAAAYIENQDQKLLHGMTGTFAILSGKTTLMEMIARSWKNFRFNK